MPKNQRHSTGLPLKRFTTFLFLFIGWLGFAKASHNMAGQITYVKIGSNQYEITLTTYTDPSGGQVDRCSADFEIFDINNNLITTINDIPRNNGPAVDPLYPGIQCNLNPRPPAGEYIVGTIKKNIYTFTYTFSGPGTFKVGYEDHARINGVVNMNNSDNTSFYVVTTINNNPWLGTNDSPQFLNDPIDFACVGKYWTHNPGGYDLEGDSLVYTLIPSKKSHFLDVDNYRYPDQVDPGPNNTFTIDPQTGLITWDAAQQTGWYNIAFRVDEYRNGVKIGEAVRDMAILVNPCQNDPPIIEAPDEFCVFPGENVQIPFKVWDPNLGDSLYFGLNNYGPGANGPFTVTPNTATVRITNPGMPNPSFPVTTRNFLDIDTIEGVIEWTPECDDIRNTFYQIDLSAHDDFSYFNTGGANQMLSDHHVIKLWVVPPPLTNLTATPGSRRVILNWNPHSCSNVLGYRIFRRVGPSGWNQDQDCCKDQPEAFGYQEIGSTFGRNNTTFEDDNNGQGFEYGQDLCYVVLAYFDNDVRSCVTNEACIQVNKDYPILTNNTVDITDPANGAITVEWSMPDTSVLDKNFNPPPYTYNIFRADGISGSANMAQINTTPLALDDTSYIDVGINTVSQGYRYYIEFLDAAGPLSESNTGSSIFLTLSPGDRVIDLSWSEYTPWPNTNYDIYRQDPGSTVFNLIASVPGTGANTHTYTDAGLVNGEEYCYYIESYGSYNSPGIKPDLYNLSQRVCEEPVDLTPPCFAPVDTDTASSCEEFTVTLSWDVLDSLCAGDLDYITIYLAPTPEGQFTYLDTVQNSTTREYTIQRENTIAGCYALTATDTVGNESDYIVYCFDNCPVLEPSNVFTPNGDQINDYFDPFRDRSVIVTSVKIFDRWGRLQFGAEGDVDPTRLWDGRIQSSGNQAQAGVYYYVIEYEEIRLGGNRKATPLTGWVTLIR